MQAMILSPSYGLPQRALVKSSTPWFFDPFFRPAYKAGEEIQVSKINGFNDTKV